MSIEKPLEKHPFLKTYTHPVKKAERAIIGREKEMNSILAAFQRPELCNVILLGEAGSGKGHPNDTLLPSPNGGYIRVGDIQVDDFVYGEDGKPVKVIGVYPQGPKRVYKVTFSDGSSVLCNDEHIWNVRNRRSHYDDRPYQNMTLRDIMDIGIHDEQMRPEGRMTKVNHWYIPIGQAVQRDDACLPIDPYVLGVMIGDGCLTDTVRTLEISSNEESVIAEVAKRIGAIRYKKRDGCYSWIFLKDDTNGNQWYQQHDFADLSEDLDCVFGQYSRNRRIPCIYMMGSQKQRMELLQGLMDADGCVTSGDKVNTTFSTKSEGLASDVQELAASLGMRTSLSSNIRHDTLHDDKPEYEVYFRVPVEMRRNLFYASCVRKNAFDDGMRQRVRRFNRHYDDMAIVDVEDMGYETDMTCIYVDSPTHLYLVGKEHIVTHNTALVQGTMLHDKKRLYLEVDLSKMIADLTDNNQMADRLKQLFNEVMECVQEDGREIVLFMDEFHQVVQLSAAAVEALKPLLADSGTRGIRVIAATTYEEFRKYISPNQPLVERLQRISLQQPGEDLTVSILKGMAKRYGVDNQFYNDNVFKLIYEYTNRYVPASSQPRKSILVLDSMVGWHRLTGHKMDAKLLADVIYETTGTNVAFRVDATSIKKELDKHVLAQKFATEVIEQRLQICVADLNDKTKPMSTMLFTGSSGTGKTETVKQLARILFDDDRNLIRFDMTEYANDDSLERFREQLTSRVWERPYSIILLDEIEKASAAVTRLLLQVIDDGRLSDQNGRETPFINSYIIMTTNAASEIYKTIAQYNADDEGSGKIMKKYDALIRRSLSSTTGDNRFPPELLGRIDAIIPFQPLSRETQKAIVKMKLQKLKKEIMAKHGATLRVSARVIDYLVEDNLSTDSDSGGARRVMSKLESELTTAVARYINSHPDISVITVDVEGQMAFENKDQLESEAYIRVGGR